MTEAEEDLLPRSLPRAEKTYLRAKCEVGPYCTTHIWVISAGVDRLFSLEEYIQITS